MKVLIVDDEAPARERLRRQLAEIAGIAEAEEAADGAEAVQRCAAERFDVVLMDIQMPRMDGLEAARHLSRLPDAPAVVFTTAYSEHALAAFEAEAVDYLLKPVRRERLARALERARRLSGGQADELARRGETGPSVRTHLTSQQQGNLTLVPVARVRYFKAEDKYVLAVFDDTEALLDESLKSLEKEFGEAFVRIHRNALVAREALKGLRKRAGGRWYALVGEGAQAQELEVSRRHAPGVRRLLRAVD